MVYGCLRRINWGLWMDVLLFEILFFDFLLELIEGVYWIEGSFYFLIFDRVYLVILINVFKGELVLVRGLGYGSKFYFFEVYRCGFFVFFKNGFLFVVEGVVMFIG